MTPTARSETQIPHVRFLDAAVNPDWRQQAEEWLTKGSEPDKLPG